MCFYSRKWDVMTWETFFIKEVFTQGCNGSLEAAGGMNSASGKATSDTVVFGGLRLCL